MHKKDVSLHSSSHQAGIAFEHHFGSRRQNVYIPYASTTLMDATPNRKKPGIFFWLIDMVLRGFCPHRYLTDSTALTIAHADLENNDRGFNGCESHPPSCESKQKPCNIPCSSLLFLNPLKLPLLNVQTSVHKYIVQSSY